MKYEIWLENRHVILVEEIGRNLNQKSKTYKSVERIKIVKLNYTHFTSMNSKNWSLIVLVEFQIHYKEYLMETKQQKWPILLNMVGIGKEFLWNQFVIAAINPKEESRPKILRSHQSSIPLQRAIRKLGKYVRYISQLAQRQSKGKINLHLIASQ